MLNLKSPHLLSTLTASCLLILAVPAAVAQAPLWNPPQEPPRECTIPVGSTASVRIIAGPDTSAPNGVGPVFPIMEPCPAPFTGICRKWEYEWIYKGLNPSHAVVAFDADVKVLAAVPTATVIPQISGDSSTGYGANVAGEVGLRFNSNAETYFARFWTPVGVGLGTVTAGFQAGKNRGYCAIAGADNLFGDPALSLTSRIETSTLGCTVVWTLSPDGCPLTAEVTEGACTVKHTDLGLNEIAVACSTEVKVPGSEQVCRYNSLLRTWTCVVVQ
jgi:hypothetical protein